MSGSCGSSISTGACRRSYFSGCRICVVDSGGRAQIASIAAQLAVARCARHEREPFDVREREQLAQEPRRVRGKPGTTPSRARAAVSASSIGAGNAPRGSIASIDSHRGVALDQRLAGELLVERQPAPAIGCGPQEASQPEALILQRMRDLVRQRRTLLGQRDEIRDQQPSRGRIVEARRIAADGAGEPIEVARPAVEQPEALEQLLVDLGLGRRGTAAHERFRRDARVGRADQPALPVDPHRRAPRATDGLGQRRGLVEHLRLGDQGGRRRRPARRPERDRRPPAPPSPPRIATPSANRRGRRSGRGAGMARQFAGRTRPIQWRRIGRRRVPRRSPSPSGTSARTAHLPPPPSAASWREGWESFAVPSLMSAPSRATLTFAFPNGRTRRCFAVNSVRALMTTPDIATLTAPERLGAGELMQKLERHLAAVARRRALWRAGLAWPRHRGAAGLGRRRARRRRSSTWSPTRTRPRRAPATWRSSCRPPARHRRSGRAAGRGAPAGARRLALRRDAAGSALDPAAHGGAVSPVAGVRAAVLVASASALFRRVVPRAARSRRCVDGPARRNRDRPRADHRAAPGAPATRARRSSRTRARSRCAAR